VHLVSCTIGISLLLDLYKRPDDELVNSKHVAYATVWE